MTTDPRARRAVLILAAFVACGLLAACGSSASSSSSTTARAVAAAGPGPGPANRTAFRNCLKAHGVTLPNRPAGSGRPRTPGAGGLFGGGGAGAGGGGGFARDPKLAAALRACGGGRFGPGAAGRRFRLSRQAITAFVSCVRKHGYNLPNPNFSGSGPVFPASIRTNPKFVAASRSCASLLTPAAPATLPQSPS